MGIALHTVHMACNAQSSKDASDSSHMAAQAGLDIKTQQQLSYISRSQAWSTGAILQSQRHTVNLSTYFKPSKIISLQVHESSLRKASCMMIFRRLGLMHDCFAIPSA